MSQPSAARDPRPLIYGAFDLVFALIYALLLWLAPSRHAVAPLLWVAVVAAALAGVGMFARRPWSWRLAAIACGLLLVYAVALLTGVVVSAAFLSGVYGSMGQGAAVIALLCGALCLELIGILPALQLKYLLTKAGRRPFGIPPKAGTPLHLPLDDKAA